jgi:type IX secretion system PorP/SprF family membrane protein
MMLSDINKVAQHFHPHLLKTIKMRNNYISLLLKISIVFSIILSANRSLAQNVPLHSQYFVNRYLSNPAMAGIDRGNQINLAYYSQWNNMPGAPVVQNITYNHGWEKVGLGLNLNLDKAGLQRQTRVMGTYAYHLALDSNRVKLHFGLSAGFMDQRINEQDLVGQVGDNQVAAYNGRDVYLDGDFGLGLTVANLHADFALVNLKNYFKKDIIKLANMPKLYAALGYKIAIDKNELEPKVIYRTYTETEDVLAVGAQFSMLQKQLFIMGMYHNTGSLGFGLGYRFKDKYLINTAYNTQTTALNNYANGSFEVNLGIKF